MSTVMHVTRGTADPGPAAGESPRLLRGLLVTLLVAALAAGAVLAMRWSAREDATADADAPATTVSAGTAGSPADAPAETAYVPPAAPAIEQEWGIRVVGVQVAASGGLALLRYQVLDETRSQRLHADGNAGVPELWSEDAEGHVATVVMGHNHYYGNGQVDGRTFVMIYGNAGGLLRAGDHVTVRMPDGLELPHVLVQT